MMNINRNTINSDIEYCYKNLSKEWIDDNSNSWILKQISRFEFQRSRLIEYLRKESEIKNKLKIEKMILDIDNQISQIAFRSATLNWNLNEMYTDEFNKVIKEHNLPIKLVSKDRILKTSDSTHEKICKLIKEDRKRFCI